MPPKKRKLEVVPATPTEETARRRRKGPLTDRRGAPTKTRTQEVQVSSRLVQLQRGEINMEDLDDEELAKGQLKADDGTFRGRPSAWVPREFWDAMVRELLKRGDDVYRGNYIKCLEVITKIAQHAEKDADRLKAAIYVIERVAGPMPTKVELKAEIKPWEEDVKVIVAEIEETG